MTVYCVYLQVGEDYSMVKIFSEKSKAAGYCQTKNANKQGWHWFFQQEEVIQ